MGKMEKTTENRYTCREYRDEMTLLGLRRRLADPELAAEERKRIEAEIRRLEQEMGMD